MWIIKAKRRNHDQTYTLGYTYTNYIFASMALSAFKAGYGSGCVNRDYTYLTILKVG